MGILTALREASVVSKLLAFRNRGHREAEHTDSRGRSLTPKKSDVQKRGLKANGAPNNVPTITEVPNGDIHGLPATEPSSVHSVQDDAEPFMGKHLPLETLFYLATMGGAEVCDLQHKIGNFETGKEFDALLIRTGQKELDDNTSPFIPEDVDVFEHQINPALFVEPSDALETIFEKFLFAGDDRNVSCMEDWPCPAAFPSVLAFALLTLRAVRLQHSSTRTILILDDVHLRRHRLRVFSSGEGSSADPRRFNRPQEGQQDLRQRDP